MRYSFEICTNSVESCLAAQQGGAQRVELCANLLEGGTTPSSGEIEAARREIDIVLHVIIRPRGGDFLYTPFEADVMEADILRAKELGADGVVFGCLTPEAELDLPLMKRLVLAAEGMSMTCHRAFDYVRDPEQALEQLVDLGVHRVLTSGQKPKAIQGADLIAKLVVQARGRIIIMPGSGVDETNIATLAARTHATEFHFSARESVPSRMKHRNPDLSMGGNSLVDEYSHSVTTAERVKKTISALVTR